MFKVFSLLMALCVAGLLAGHANAAATRKKVCSATAEGGSVGLAPEGEAVSSRSLFNKVKDKLVIVQCDESSGSGFVCEMSGKRYFVTNRHVIEGQQRVVAILENAKRLKFDVSSMEMGVGADLVRFTVATNQPALVLSEKRPEMNESVYVFGNSEGGEVFTDITGSVLGVGPNQFEVSAKFVHGNSGSAVLDECGQVLGVATFAIRQNDPKDWVKQDTRFTDVRRFALSLHGVEWRKIGLKELNRRVAEREKRQKEENGVLPEVRASFKTPVMKVNKKSGLGWSRYYVNGDFTLSMSDADVKNPVIRVVMLLSCGRSRVVMDAVSCEPKGKYNYRGVPVYSYGMRNSSWTYDVGNGVSAYYLEGLSYYQRPFAYDKARGIEYFDRAKLLTGGFAVPGELVSVGVVPKILAVRLECWQNGSLAAVYNSTRPDTLNSKKIPVDWFVLGRYSKMFDYVSAEYEAW